MDRLGKTIWPPLYIYNRILRAGEHETRREKEGEKETVHSPGHIIRGTKSDGSEAGSARAIQKNFFHCVALTFSDLGGGAPLKFAPRLRSCLSSSAAGARARARRFFLLERKGQKGNSGHVKAKGKSGSTKETTGKNAREKSRA